MSKKDVLIRGLDDSVYQRARALAASKGITMGSAVDQALSSWMKEMEGAADMEAEVERNREFVQSEWNNEVQRQGSSRLRGKASGSFPHLWGSAIIC